MPLVDMKDMLHHAYRNRYAVGAFDLVSLDDSYRDHSDHVAFADGLFRPIARERLSIDYRLTECG